MAAVRNTNRSGGRNHQGRQANNHHAAQLNGGVKVTEDQIERAKLMGLDDVNPELREEIQKVADVTKKSVDEASIALHDNNFNTTLAIQQLLEGENIGEWMTCDRKGRGQRTSSFSADGKDKRFTNGAGRGSRGRGGVRRGGSRGGGSGRGGSYRGGFSQRDSSDRGPRQNRGSQSKALNSWSDEFSSDVAESPGVNGDVTNPAVASDLSEKKFQSVRKSSSGYEGKSVSWADEVNVECIRSSQSGSSQQVANGVDANPSPNDVSCDVDVAAAERSQRCVNHRPSPRPGVVVVPLEHSTEPHHCWYPPSDIEREKIGVCKVRRPKMPTVAVEMPQWVKVPDSFGIEFGDLCISQEARHDRCLSVSEDQGELSDVSSSLSSLSRSTEHLPDLCQDERESAVIGAPPSDNLSYDHHQHQEQQLSAEQQIASPGAPSSLSASSSPAGIAQTSTSSLSDVLHAPVLGSSLVDVPREEGLSPVDLPSRQQQLLTTNEVPSSVPMMDSSMRQSLSLSQSLEQASDMLHSTAMPTASSTTPTNSGEQLPSSMSSESLVVCGSGSQKSVATAANGRSASQSKVVSPTMMLPPGGAPPYNVNAFLPGVPPFAHYTPDLEAMQQQQQRVQMTAMRDGLPLYQQGGDGKFSVDPPTSSSQTGAGPSAGAGTVPYMQQHQQLMNYYNLYPHAFMYPSPHLPPFAPSPYAYPPPLQQKGHYGPSPYMPPGMAHGYSNGMPGYEEDYAKTTYQTTGSQGQSKSSTPSSLSGNVADSYKGQSYDNAKPVLPGQYNVPVSASGQPLTTYPLGHTAAMLYGNNHHQHGGQVAVTMHSHQPMLHSPLDNCVTGANMQTVRASSTQTSYPAKLQQASKPYAFNTHGNAQMY